MYAKELYMYTDAEQWQCPLRHSLLQLFIYFLNSQLEQNKTRVEQGPGMVSNNLWVLLFVGK